MFGMMMEYPLLISSLIEHAARFHGDTEIVSREADRSLHRYTFAAAHDRALTLAHAEIGKDVADITSIGQTQMVAVEVRFAAVSSTAMEALGINLQRLGDSGFQFSSNAPNTVSSTGLGL